MEQTLQAKMAPGNKALRVMEEHLQDRSYFVGDRYTIADMALFAYTHVADEGNFSLAEFPSICKWIERVKSQPGFVPIG